MTGTRDLGKKELKSLQKTGMQCQVSQQTITGLHTDCQWDVDPSGQIILKFSPFTEAENVKHGT